MRSPIVELPLETLKKPPKNRLWMICCGPQEGELRAAMDRWKVTNPSAWLITGRNGNLAGPQGSDEEAAVRVRADQRGGPVVTADRVSGLAVVLD